MFNSALQDTFVTFSLLHIIPVVIIFIIIGLIVFFKDHIAQSNYVHKIAIGLATITILQEISLNIYRIVVGEWLISTSLPFQLCGLGVLVSSYLLITKKEKSFQNVFFVMMLGATLAIITPGIENNLGFPHYRYYQYFTSHGLIIINFSYLLFVYNFQKNFKYKHLFNNLVTLIVVASFMAVVNVLTEGNYMYIMAKPGTDTAFDLFGEWPWYLLNIFIFGIPIFFHLFYIPFFIRDIKRSNGFKQVSAKKLLSED